MPSDLGDDALVKSLSGFENGYAAVNGTRLHYVTGGEGTPLVLRMDKAWLGSVDISIKKAFTARAFDLSTKELAAAAQSARAPLCRCERKRRATRDAACLRCAEW